MNLLECCAHKPGKSSQKKTQQQPVCSMLGIRSRIRMFFGLLNLDPDPLVRGADPDPDPSILKQKYYEKH
jgi:hypothetical protein